MKLLYCVDNRQRFNMRNLRGRTHYYYLNRHDNGCHQIYHNFFPQYDYSNFPYFFLSWFFTCFSEGFLPIRPYRYRPTSAYHLYEKLTYQRQKMIDEAWGKMLVWLRFQCLCSCLVGEYLNFNFCNSLVVYKLTCKRVVDIFLTL